MMQLPKDPVMLLSFTNMQLRDYYPTFAEFCKAFMVDEKTVTDILDSIDYKYDSRTNQFI